jgi:DNA-binding response OmpR family regulator
MTTQLSARTFHPLVLLVEDDVDTREMYHMALEFDGCCVVDAPGSGDVMPSALEIQPDIIVTDIGLRGVHDGVGLARALRGNPKTAGIPVLAVTGRDPRALGDDADLFDAVYVKPLLPHDLSARVREGIARSRKLRERSARAQARGADLMAEAQRQVDRAQQTRETSRPQAEPCPRCGGRLTWSDRRKLYGVTFDYFLPCQHGCGLFCYNHADRTMVRLVGE